MNKNPQHTPRSDDDPEWRGTGDLAIPRGRLAVAWSALRTWSALIVALLGIGATAVGYELAIVPATSAAISTAQVEHVAMMGVLVDQGTLGPPISTRAGLEMADYKGAVQQSLTATSSPYQLCPQGAVRKSAQAIHEMQTYTVAEINRYFTGVQRQVEMRSATDSVTYAKNLTPNGIVPTLVPSSTLAQATQTPCSSSMLTANTWFFDGPDVTSLVQWSSVVIGTHTASVVGVFAINEETCNVSPKANASGAHRVTGCGGPSPGTKGYTSVTILLSQGPGGTWKVDQLTYPHP